MTPEQKAELRAWRRAHRHPTLTRILQKDLTDDQKAELLAWRREHRHPVLEPLRPRDMTPEQKAELKVWRAAHHWHPHQLRHSAATRLRKEFDLDVARIILGHSSPVVTEIYAELDREKAIAAMERVG
jgi:integrase